MPRIKVPGAPRVAAGAGTDAALLLDLGEDLGSDVEIRRNPLDVVMILEHLHELQGLFGILIAERDEALGHLRELRREGGNALRGERGLHSLELLGWSRDLIGLWIVGVHVLGSRIEHDAEERLLVHDPARHREYTFG